MHKVWRIFVVCGFLVLLLTGCTSTRTVEPAVLEHQRQLGEYKGAVEGYIKRAGDCAEEIGAIGERANDIGSEIDRVIQLFDNYQRAVDRFIQEYNQLRSKIESLDKSTGDAGNSAADTDAGKRSGLHTVLQGSQGSAVA